MNRFAQTILILCVLWASWLGMQVFHELGHVFGGVLTGAVIENVYLHPLIISHTELSQNAHPLIVVWAGPFIGGLVPLLLFFAATLFKMPFLYLLRFFAGFCLVANGAYIALGPVEGSLDTAVILMSGGARYQTVIFGLITIPMGLYLWHNQGRYFGFGGEKGAVEKGAVMLSVGALMTIVLIELAFWQ